MPRLADFNHNCYVDSDDLALFTACLTGPGLPYQPDHLPAGCTLIPDPAGHLPADLDKDGDVDQDDFGVFQRCYTGATFAADAGCVD